MDAAMEPSDGFPPEPPAQDCRVLREFLHANPEQIAGCRRRAAGDRERVTLDAEALAVFCVWLVAGGLPRSLALPFREVA